MGKAEKRRGLEMQGFIQNGIPTDTLEAALDETYSIVQQPRGGKRHEQIAWY
jgi:hypothetical protein